MSIFRQRAADLQAFINPPAFPKKTGGGTPAAMRRSSVWACLRVRADLISTLPVDVRRKVGSRSATVDAPDFFRKPQALGYWIEWLAASQLDLDRYGNAFGHIVRRGGDGCPAQIELSPATDWVVRRVKGELEYRCRGKKVDTLDVWHERQYPTAGSPVGMTAIGAAMNTIEHQALAEEFATTWFTAGAAPSGVLKNTAKRLTPEQAEEMKRRFRIATANRGLFVTGSDWEFEPAAAAASDAKFLDSMEATHTDICRFLGVPADIIDASTGAATITYANITQRNLQLLTIHLGPAIQRREEVFSNELVRAPRFVKFNTDAMLRMDSKTKLEMLGLGVDKRIYTPDEARELLDMGPLQQSDIDQFSTLFPTKAQPVAQIGVK